MSYASKGSTAMLHTVSGNVQSVDHVASSHSANPTMRVTLTDGSSYLTETDGGVGYSAGNFRPHSLRLPVSPVVLTIGKRDRIVAMCRPAGWVAS